VLDAGGSASSTPQCYHQHDLVTEPFGTMSFRDLEPQVNEAGEISLKSVVGVRPYHLAAAGLAVPELSVTQNGYA